MKRALFSNLKSFLFKKSIKKTLKNSKCKNMLRLGIRREHIFCMPLYLVAMLNCKLMPNTHTTSPDGNSECGYTKATSDTCTSFEKT